MSAPKPAGGFALVRLRLSGLAFLVVIVLLLALSVALYNKSFTKVVKVKLLASSAGNQLTAPADVKVRGLIVGEVRKVESTGDGAQITLALDPGKAKLIPANVSALLLPKTLFGEKYVSLVLPSSPSAQHLVARDVIRQSTTSIETSKVLDDLLPLLTSLDPQDLNATLNAVSGALRGRGNEIGDNLVRVRDYLVKLNPSLPTIQQDLKGLADLADNVDEATPDLLRTLDNLSFSSRSLVDQSKELTTFLSTTTAFASSATSLVQQNGDRLITVARESLPGLQLFAQYSPAYGCFLKGLDRYSKVVGTTFGGAQPGLRITLEVTKDNGGFVAGDEPAYLDDGPPACRGLPSSTTVPAPDEEFKDGYRDAERAGINGQVSTRGAVAPQVLGQSDATQEQVLRGVIAPVLGTTPTEVPDLATLMFAPLARGATVGLVP